MKGRVGVVEERCVLGNIIRKVVDGCVVREIGLEMLLERRTRLVVVFILTLLDQLRVRRPSEHLLMTVEGVSGGE